VPNTDEYEGMIAETVMVQGHNGDYINAYYARPTGPGPFPGMMLFHHRPGWDELYREFTRKFAHHGYATICPNLYFRAGHGAPDDVAARVRAGGGDVSDEQVVADGLACVASLRALPITSGKVAVMGTCSGGRHAYLAACQGEVDAAIDCWGGRVVMAPSDLNDNYPVAPIDLTKDLSCPVLGLFGNDDQAPSPEQVDQHEQALREHGKTYEFHRYPDAGHGFFYYDRPAAYRAAQAVDGWEKIWDFLERTVG
jgi:carboxymethylenebutenolidase